ncbi:HepT-like ribonuclease domain-containing protein [Ramlibacter tataouinensis]|uniref:DUF86 domain-containing protein n=1 Tax=Ramlibacter tataouinensis (strain ATCC BAA-407 / DSM 14655 / LMG 21543 / TTB310) TaxID=365046 RepID=F5XX09_RAMTT|nr:DUF86 domain-containing protein [Ramlibacter tataouinensis]AEG91770.1 Conserved hypothetical protein [Ramlibacter tataouinensis TTB310]
MKAEPRLLDYLHHLREAAQQIRNYTSGMDKAAFLADSRTQQAVFFNFVILGEACARLMAGHADFLARHPQVPWRSIRDMRNQVAHGYFTIDTEVVWRTVQDALPDLLAKLPVVIAAADQQATSGRPPASSAS